MKIPLLPPVVPPHVFCLLANGVTWANVRRDPAPGFVDSRHFAYPPNTLGSGPSGTPLFSRDAIVDAVEVARKLSGGLSRASVVFPDSWARILPIDFDTLPESEEAVRDMVLWKLKKLLPGISEDLSVVFDQMPKAGEEGELRLLVAAAPAEMLRSIEQSFESVGVRVGTLAPSSLVLFDGLSPVLGTLAGGDYGLLHRSPGSLVFVIARDGSPVFFRQRPEEEGEEGEDQDQEVRLSLSYYFEKLQGAGLSAVYVHDAAPGRELASGSVLPVQPTRLSGSLFSADRRFDERVAARPELLSAFAAVNGKS